MAISTTLFAIDEFTLHQKFILAAARLGKTIPTVPYLLDELVKKGFVQQTANGSRSLTDLGNQAVESMKHELNNLDWPEQVSKIH